VGLFEATNKTRVAMTIQVGDLLSSYSLLNKIIVYMKDEAMAICPPLHGLLLLLLVIFFWNFQFHVLALLLAKHANMFCNDTNVFIGFCEVSLKTTQSTLQKQSHGLRSLAKDTMNGRRHVSMMGSPIENP
jgi:hypothetical protein